MQVFKAECGTILWFSSTSVTNPEERKNHSEIIGKEIFLIQYYAHSHVRKAF